MDKETIEIFRDKLKEELDNLKASTALTVSGLIGQENIHADLLDRATTDMGQGFLLRIRDRERHLMNKIKDALERIEDGSFGICETCGDEIGIKRLHARPVATLCITCKTKQEMLEVQ